MHDHPTLLFTFFFSRPATAAALPTEFTGFWIVAEETQNECKKQDWKAEGKKRSSHQHNGQSICKVGNRLHNKMGQNVTRVVGRTNVRRQLELQRRRKHIVQQRNLVRS